MNLFKIPTGKMFCPICNRRFHSTIDEHLEDVYLR